MRNRRESANGIVTIILGIITILALTICIIFISLYLKTVKDYQEMSSSVSTMNSNSMEQVDFQLPEEEEIMGQDSEEINQEIPEQNDNMNITENTRTDDGTQSLFRTFDNESFFAGLDQNTVNTMKAKMQDIVVNQEAGLVTMLRYFFPEKLIFYDKGAYQFADILDSVEKHSYHASDFNMDDSGEITYSEGGEVVSHKAIDVSKYQGSIDWQAVAGDGVEYAYIRLGIRGYRSGELVLDDTFADNMLNAQNAGIKTGVYIFTQAINVEEAIEEADFVIENLEGYDVECPVVFDVEMITDGDGRANHLTMEERTAICIAFCERIKEAGYTPMIYGNIKCFVNMIDLTQLESYEKWFAFYDSYLYCPYKLSMWQYTESGHVKGIEGKVDLNISFKEW